MADIFDEIELPQSAPSAESTGGGGDIFDKVVQSNPDLPEIARITRTEGLRSELTKRMQDMKMFPSFTAAATGAADKNIRRNAEGKWDLPVMTLQSDSGFANFAKGLGTTLGQKTGDRLRNQLIGDEANQIRSVFENFQKDNNLSDDEVQTVWSDLVNRYRRFEDNEILRVQSDGSIEPNPMSSGILDTEKATKAINESGASDVAKRAMIAQLPQLQEAVAENKAKAIEAYAEGDDSFRTWLARRSVDVATRGATFLPRLLDGDRPEFERSGDIVADVKAFEKIIEQEPALREKLRAVENDLGYQGLGKLGQQFAGLAGMVGSERAAEAAGKMGERMALAAQGGEDLGLLGDVLKEVPSVAVQALVTRGAGAAAGGLPSATAARGVTAMTAYATAGLQSAGLTFADEYQAALNEGATEGEAMSVARTKAARAGLSTALITSAFGTGKIGGVESAAAGRAAAEMTLRDLATMAGEKGIRETVKSAGFRQFAKGTMLDVVGEVTEEGIDQLIEAFINADPDTNLADAWDQAIEAGLVGGVIGGVVNVTRSALQRGQAAQLAIEAQKKGASEAAAAAMETAVSPEPAVSPEGETVTEAPEAAETVTEAPNASPAGVSPATGAVVTSALQTPLNIYRATLPDGSSRIVYGESEQDALNRFGVQGATTKLVTADAKGGSVDSARSIVVLSEQAKIDGVDLTKMTREQYVDYAKKNGRYLDGDAIRMRADLRVQDSVADAVDAKAMRSQNESLRFKASKAYDDMTTRLKVVRNAAVDVGRTITKGYINALDHADGWVNFGIKGDPSKSSQQTGKATKAYFGFGDGFISAITEVNLKELLSRLHAAGYNGQLKIGEGSLQMSRLGDQMVAHGKTDADTQIAAQVIEGFFAEQSSAAGTPNPLVDVNFGRDGKTSYSELLSEQTKQASLATPAAQTARQPAAPPTEGAGQVTAEALQRVADNTATPEDVAPLVEQGLVEQIDGQNVITEAGVAQMETPPRLTPEERRGEIAGGVAVSPVRVYHGSPKGPPEGGLRPSKADDFPLLGSSVSTDRGVAERYAQDVDFRQGGATNPIVSEFDFSGNVVDVSDLRKQWESRGGAWEDASSEQITRFALEQGYDAVDLASAGMGEPGELFILRTENLSAPQPQTPATTETPIPQPPATASPQPEAAPTAPLPEGTAPPETGGAEVVVSPEQDASYLSAVESGDTRAAQEAVDSAAESVGADVKTPLYRGRQRFAPRFRGKAVYLVKYPDEAKTYAEEYGGPEGVVTKAYPKFKKTATEEDVRRVAEKNRISFTDEAFPVAYLDVNTKLREALIAEGYDSATGRDALPDDQGDISVYVSLAPDENLVIADSVVRDDQGNVVPLSERFPSTEATQPQTPQADEAQESQQGQGRQQEVRPQGLQGGETEVQEAVAPETPVPDEGAGAVSPEVAAQEEVTRILSQGTEGRPIRVFHGGDADFTFTEDTGRSEYSREKDFGDGVPYFTARENWAFQYAAFGDESTDYDAIPEGRAMHAADITMQAPLVVSFYQDSNIANTPQWAKLREELASAGVDEQSLQLVEQNNRFRDYRQATAILATPFGGWTEARAAFKRAGYDGIIAEFGPQGDSTIQVIPFNASSVKLAPEGQDIGQTPPETPPTDKIPTEPPPLPGGRQMPQEGDTYGVKKAKLNEARARMGQPPLESNSFGSREDAMARAFETLERDPDAAKKLASRTQGEVDRGGKNAITAYTGDEWAVVNIYKAQQEVALADKTREWFNENASGNRQVADELWGDIEQQEEALREFISRISLAGSKAGADFRAMQDTLLEDFSLEGLTRNYRKQVKNGEPLTKEETATLAEAAETLEREQNTLNLMTLADEMEKAGRTKEAAALVKVAELIDSLQKEVAAERKRPISASKRRDIKKRLSTAAENAKKRLEAAGVYNLGVTPQPESPLQSARVLKDMATVMGAKLADKLIDGTISLQEFTLDLIETFGEKVRPFSERIYEETKKLGDSLRSPGAEPVTPEQIIDSIDRESDLDRKDVWALAKAHVAQGKTGSKVMDAVLSDLKPLFPDLTREQVVQEFTDYGVIQKPNPEPTAKELRRIKQLELEYMKLLDIERGELPKRTGRQRDETDADVRQARKETREKLRALEDKMREAGIEVPSDAQRQKTALQSLKRRMDNEIAELEAAIESGKPVVAVTRNGVVMDEDAAETRKRLEETRARYREMFPKKEITREEQIERAMKALDRQIANEEKMLRDGITERTRTQPLVTPELEAKRQHLSDLREQRRALDPKNSPLEQAIRARRAANEKLEQVLKTNDLAVRRRQKVEPDAVLQELIETGDALRAEIRERRKLLPESPSAYKARTQRELQQAEKRLAEVERIIEEGDIAVRKSPSPKATDPAVTKVRNKIKEANKRIAAMRREAMPEEERAMRYAKALDKRTADLERRIREKDFSPLTKKARPINHPIADEARARHLDAVERHSEFIFQKIYERQNFITKVLKNSIDLAFAVPKAVMASGDASGFGKQGLKMLMAHPLVALKAYSKNFYYSHKSANAAAAALRQRENYPLYLKMGLQFKSARDGQRFRDIHEAYQSRLAKKIPVLGKLVGWSENGYTTFLNQIMADAADVFLANAKNVPGSMTEDNLKMIADHINMLSGTSSFRGFEQYGPALGAILWAPKFLFSQFGAIKGVTYSALDATTGFRLGDVVDQKLKKRDSSTRWARKALAADNARMVGGYVAMGLFFKALTALYNELKGEDDDEMEYEPDMRSTDFGKLKIGDTRYDFGGGMLQALVFGARAITGKVKRADGTVENIADTPGFADQTRLDLAWRFARSKLGPSQGMVVNMLQKTDFLGNPYYWESELVGNYVPLPAQELYESYRQGGMSHSLARTALSFHGFTSNRYGDETDARYNSEIGKDIMDNVLFPVINFAATPTGKRIRPNRYDLPPEAKAWIDR